MSYSYASQKFSNARMSMMLPHPQGEAASIASAFSDCDRGLDRFDRNLLDDSARGWVLQLDELMSTKGLSDPNKEGLHLVKARTLSVDDQYRLSNVINELECWFSRHED